MDISTLADEICARASAAVHSDWEDTGLAYFDPFGEFREYISQTLTDLMKQR